jgi:hypothetical protein
MEIVSVEVVARDRLLAAEVNVKELEFGNVPVRVPPMFACRPPQQHQRPGKHEVVNPPTIANIIGFGSRVVNRYLRLIYTI